MVHRPVLLPSAVLAILALIPCARSAARTQDGREIARTIFPSVVLLEMSDSSGRMIAQGSGFFVREDVVATNYHVIEGAAKGFAKVVGQNAVYAIAGVVGTDVERDLALLKLEGAKAPPLRLADISRIEVGEQVFALGNPKGLEGTISPGIVSGIGIRQVNNENLIQITAPISPGSSGGPVVNKNGEVIGVASSSLSGGQNLNFAVPGAYLALLVASAKAVMPLDAFAARAGKKEVAQGRISGTPCGGPEDPRIGRLGYSSGGYADFGDYLFRQGRYTEARDAYVVAIRMKPNNEQALHNLGNVYVQLRCFDDAVESLQSALRLKPKEADIYHSLGLAYDKMGRCTDAVETYREALRFKPKFGKVFMGLGLCYAKLNRHSEAIEAFKECIRLDYDKPFAYSFIGTSALQLRQLDEAKKWFQEAIRKWPQEAAAHEGLGQLYVVLKDKESAMEQYRILTVLSRVSADWLYNLIQTYLK